MTGAEKSSRAPAASVVIRAKNEERDLPRTLAALDSQTIAADVETIVVDSGSTDRTVAICREFGIEPIEIPSRDFTYGGALNVGCAEARGGILIALSAHAMPRRTDWLERMIELFDDPRLACACGYANGPDGNPLRGSLVQDAELARAKPYWGYSNAAGAFRAELWRERPFREDLPGTEDKEWARHWLSRGWFALVDPGLAVEHDHSDEGLLLTYRRARREAHGLGMFAPLEYQDARDVARSWWNESDGRPSHLRARLSPRRVAKLLGRWRGHRTAKGRHRKR